MCDTEFENKLPASIDDFLHKLYVIRDALVRKNFQEAHVHIGDSLAAVQNEIDWCYRTDPVLVYIRDFLLQLQRTIGVLQNVAPSHLKPVLQDTTDIMSQTLAELTHMTSSIPRWGRPDASIDMLERRHRAYTYGYNEAEKSDA